VTLTPTATPTPGPPGDFNCDTLETAADVPALLRLLGTDSPDRCGAPGPFDERDIRTLIERIFTP